jgi:bifunctional non-homologous end joining protein LigD
VRVTPVRGSGSRRRASSVPAYQSFQKLHPTGELWVHEVKHDGYRLQVHVRAGRVRLYTMNGADWTERYPRIVEEAARLKRDAVLDCEVICTNEDGRADFDRLHSRCFEDDAVACAFDLLEWTVMISAD